MVVYENCKICGPYKGKDGRFRISVYFPSGERKTVSYPKYLVEINLNRYLEENETVDHIDCDFGNNDILNLRVLVRKEHISLDVKRCKTQSFVCPECFTEFSLSSKKLHNAIQNRRKGKAGPFCSRQCAGKYGQKVQVGETDKLDVIEVVPSYTTNKSEN